MKLEGACCIMKNIGEKKLWTSDFTCITLATVLSAIGGEAMNLPVSLSVFEETKSTFLSSLIMICGMLPDIILPVFVAPLIDTNSKKRWAIYLEILMAFTYGVMGLLVLGYGFRYEWYLIFTFIVATISVLYRLTYSAWYPDLIPVGLEQKGYAISGMIYPIIIIMMSPIATFLYERVAMSSLFFFVFLLCLGSVFLKSRIQEDFGKKREITSFKKYRDEIKEGFSYLKKEKGIRNIYLYMSVTSGASDGINIVTQAYYQTQTWLSVTMLGFLKSAEMLGRVCSGYFQYKMEIPPKKRYRFIKFVYTFYDTMDAFLLWMPYPLMLLNRFFCGALGTSSATIRETAVQSYLPSDMRARVNAIFNIIFAVGGIFFQFLAGGLGQMLSYQTVSLLLGSIAFVAMIMLIVIPKKENQPIYEAERRSTRALENDYKSIEIIE